MFLSLLISSQARGLDFEDTWWTPLLETLGLKCWFHALALSIALSLDELFRQRYPSERKQLVPAAKEDSSIPLERRSKLPTPPESRSQSQTRDGKPERPDVKGRREEVVASTELDSPVRRNLLSDCCDIFLPASALGWL